MKLLIELPDEQASELTAQASAEGISLAEWIQRRAVQTIAPPSPHIADIITELMSDVPTEVMAAMPSDGASQHDHYIYGWPRRTE